ncbi:3'-5' exonuclease [Thermoactinomyces sp. CICC 10521]|uniref:3'-5' exonuclease n=1 Tax=Thermoactinomyces sp. CICC 10521 TaxID=2767426 RepID=UPI0018DC8F0E|nr:3'-5' exonuclease [Thermoactinomyces sp. CICC 10521]MBH8608920.1 3'-5' exonuclease [Thermoactinomyces sp. CICC 10521]
MKNIFDFRQAEAQIKFNQWNEHSDAVVILGVETTALHCPEIIEISVIDTSGNVLFDSLVKPKGEISEIHRITPDKVADAPTFPEIWPALYNILKDKLVLIFNADFDHGAIVNSLAYPAEINQARGLNTACVMREYALLYGGKWPNLAEACGNPTDHRALANCLATLEIIKSCHDPSFTEEDLKRVIAYEEIDQLSRRIRSISYQIAELVEEQQELLKRQKEWYKQYVLGIEGTKDEIAVTTVDPDIDDDLPF